MSATEVLARLEACRIVPVVTLDDAGQARDLVDVLIDAGIESAEFTLRTPAGITAIAAVAGTAGFSVGAGTVMTLGQLEACADAGAEFVVSPGFDADVVQRTQELDLASLPGVATATELGWAARAGLGTVKFFPADRLGGLGTIAALSGPFPGMRFLPSGGVGPTNLVEYLRHPAVFAVGGSWMMPRDAVVRRDYSAIHALASEAAQLAASSR